MSRSERLQPRAGQPPFEGRGAFRFTRVPLLVRDAEFRRVFVREGDNKPGRWYGATQLQRDLLVNAVQRDRLSQRDSRVDQRLARPMTPCDVDGREYESRHVGAALQRRDLHEKDALFGRGIARKLPAHDRNAMMPQERHGPQDLIA